MDSLTARDSEGTRMRIERTGEEGVSAILDENEARVLSRSLEHIPAFLREARGALRRPAEGRGFLVASFRDEASLGAFLGRFMPGKLKGLGGFPAMMAAGAV
jgi:hypothetical protein